MATKITYTQQGDYLLPDLKLPEQPTVKIGIWGKRHLRYLEKHHPRGAPHFSFSHKGMISLGFWTIFYCEKNYTNLFALSIYFGLHSSKAIL